jgi:DMSO/TMAO reductase YedYZ molybdopterin-dependent catalytic subunit
MPLFKSLEERKKLRASSTRRKFLFAMLAGIGVYYGHRRWRFRARPVSQRDSTFITPNADFFDISVNPAFRPEVDIDSYRLTIQGPSQTSISISYEELRLLPNKHIVRTLMCIGNSVGGTGIGNAEWTVTPLKPLIDQILGSPSSAGVHDLHVCFYGLDGFYSSVPLEVAVDPETYLAFEMNKVRLPHKHGFPVRVLIPDKFGMKQPRWLEKIVIGESVPSGYWERRGWSSDSKIKMTARIDSSRPDDNGLWKVKGIAFCGDRRVGGVEISDDSENWHQARLLEPSRKGCWSTWDFQWSPPRRGDHILTVRVFDNRENRQIESYSGSFRSGSTGLHRVWVKV